MANSDSNPVTILMAEDDDGHATLIQGALRSAGLINPLLRFRDGQEILNYLRGASFEADKTYLLLLDIQMPRVDGIEVLSILKTDPHLKSLPVIMLTTTDDPREIQRCYELGCNWYIIKPVDFTNFVETLNRVGLFIQVVKVSSFAEKAGL